MDFSQLRLLTRRSAGSGPTRLISQPRFGDVSNLRHWHCQPAACFASCNLQPILHTFRRACNLQPDNQPCRLKETSTHNLQQHTRRSRGYVAHGRQQLVGALTCDANRPLSQPASVASWVCDGAPEPSAELHWKPFRNECSERRITGQRPRLSQKLQKQLIGTVGVDHLLPPPFPSAPSPAPDPCNIRHGRFARPTPICARPQTYRVRARHLQ